MFTNTNANSGKTAGRGEPAGINARVHCPVRSSLLFFSALFSPLFRPAGHATQLAISSADACRLHAAPIARNVPIPRVAAAAGSPLLALLTSWHGGDVV